MENSPLNVTKPVPIHEATPKQVGDNHAEMKIAELEKLEMDGVQTTEIEYRTGSKFYAVVVALALALILVGLDNTILATAVPSITNHFKTIADIGCRLTSCSFQFMFGKLYTLFPVKSVFIIALVIFESGSLLAGAAPTSKAFIIGRAISGVGTAGIISGCFSMITRSVPLRQRSLFGGALSAVEEIASLCAPLLGGVLTDKLSWRWCFFLNLPIGAITLLVVTFFFSDPLSNPNLSLSLRKKFEKMDLLGTAVFLPSMTSLLLALQWGGNKYGWGNVRIIALFILFVVLVCAFAWLQYRRQDSATLPPRIVLQRSVLSGCFFIFCNNAALAIVEYYMPIYFQVVKEVSASKSGVMVIPGVVGLIISLLFSGIATSIVGFYTPFALLTSIITPVAAGLLTTLEVDAKLASLICYQALLGFGVGIGFQTPQVAVQTIFSQQDVPLGIAVIQFAQGIGPAIFVSVAQTLFTNRLTADLHEYAPNLDAVALESMGLSDIKEHIGANNLEKALLSYDKAVTQTFYLPVALTCLSLLGSLGMEWRSVKQKRA